MWRRLAAVAMAVLAGVVPAGCDVTNAVDGPVCVIGDSNLGLTHLNLSLNLRVPPYYPVMKWYPGLGLVRDVGEGTIVDADDVTTTAVAQTAVECVGLGASALAVSVGVNDAQWAQENGADAYRTSYVEPFLEMVDQASPGIPVVWPTPPEVAGMPSSSGMTAVSAAIRSVDAARESLHVIEVEQIFDVYTEACVTEPTILLCATAGTREEMFKPGDIHYSEAGLTLTSAVLRLGLDCWVADPSVVLEPDLQFVCDVLAGGDLPEEPGARALGRAIDPATAELGAG